MPAKTTDTALWLVLVGLSALGGWLVLGRDNVSATPLPTALQLEALDAGSAADAGLQPVPTTATIAFITVPAVSANVTWGKKLLGRISAGKPLVVVRPRDSGPLDVMVRAGGYLAVQTRAHTFSDSRVVVKLTPIDKKSELLGYRLPIDAGPDGAVDAGPAAEAGAPSAWGDAGFFQTVPLAPNPQPWL